MSAKALLSASASAAKVYVEDVFSTYLYTGNGSTQTITNGVDLAGKGGLVWTKERIGPNDHLLYDTNRGTGKYLSSNTTTAETTNATTLTSFNSDGFSLGVNASYNGNGTTYASWTLRKAPKFFDVVTWTGTGANRTIAHNLGSVPGCIIIKCTSTGTAWPVWHRGETRTAGTPARTYLLELDTTGAGAYPGASGWIDNLTSTTFDVGPGSNVNFSGNTYVAYIFAHDAGGFGDAGTDNVVSCGTVNDSGYGVTVNLGWEPQWILLKRTNSTGNWIIIDNMRGWPMPAQASRQLFPNTAGAEYSSEAWGNPTATGFFLNAAAPGDYIYIAIRRGPMKTPTVGTQVFSAINSDAATGTVLTPNFALDFQFIRRRGASNISVVDRLRGVNTNGGTMAERVLYTDLTNAEAAASNRANTDSWSNISFKIGSNFGGVSYMYYSFRRAPGFFDVVAYTGTGTSTTQAHNLGAVPELMIIKSRGTAGTNWAVYSLLTPSTYRYNTLQTDNAGTGGKSYGPGGSPNFEELSAQPTSTVINLASSAESNFSGRTFVAYLFATAPGVSKVGNYTGTGTTKQIDCGFTAGARFVLIKRTDSTGDWWVYDTTRGIVSGNDPYFLFNVGTAEDNYGATDYIDPLSSGFEISSTAPAAINANGGSFIFLAIS